ncbi:MAG TPA: leucyl aminopeptidase [Acidimicrobiales bacterium]|nr:leucyl aminopeptidase [Acidimicrobiales bacterium]
MTIETEVVGPDGLEDRPEAVGVPVLAATDGLALPAGTAEALASLGVTVDLDPAWAETRGFTGRPGQSLVLQVGPGAPVVVLLGLGGPDGLDQDRWRKAGAALVRALGEGGTAAVPVVPAATVGVGPAGAGQGLAEGAALAAYRFTPYKSSPRPGPLSELSVVGVGTDEERQALTDGVARGVTAAEAVTFARDLVNRPASDLTPTQLAELAANRLEGRPGVTVEVWDEDRIAEERLGGLLGVSRGSVQPPRLVWAAYVPLRPEGETAPHVVLVGKGITFDSGGLSLKTADGMTTMKTDMSGAAAVLGAISAASDLGAPIRITAITPITENMPGGSAIKPGDVLTIRNGSTIEVLNTDAEGRLVLADALALAAELDPDAIVDLATLTGAATVALGSGMAALFGSDDDVIGRVRAAAARAGEPMWPLPLPEQYEEHLDSEVADMKNIGRPGQAGAIVAALLLRRFTNGQPWVHLDIAGPARSTESSGIVVKGGTGFGVRTLVELVTSWTDGAA